MIGILIVAHGSLADSLVECATHVLGTTPARARHARLHRPCRPDERQKAIQTRLAELDEGDGILVLTDVYGATPSNTLCRLLEPAHIEGVSGVNLPMLLKALNYRDMLALPQLVERIVEGGRNSINHITEACAMQQRDVEIVNKLGLHARPSAKLTIWPPASRAMYSWRAMAPHQRQSIMGVMMLAAAKGSTITLENRGRRRNGCHRSAGRVDFQRLREDLS